VSAELITDACGTHEHACVVERLNRAVLYLAGEEVASQMTISPACNTFRWALARSGVQIAKVSGLSRTSLLLRFVGGGFDSVSDSDSCSEYSVAGV